MSTERQIKFKTDEWQETAVFNAAGRALMAWAKLDGRLLITGLHIKGKEMAWVELGGKSVGQNEIGNINGRKYQ